MSGAARARPVERLEAAAGAEDQLTLLDIIWGYEALADTPNGLMKFHQAGILA